MGHSREANSLARNGLTSSNKIPVVIHVDLDGGEHIFHAHGWSYRSNVDKLFESGFLNALRFFQQEGVKATFFVIAEDLRNEQKYELLKEAIAQGHEMASHTFTHQNLTKLNKEQKRYELFQSKEILLKKLGVTVQGFRAPGFFIDRETLELLNEAGYIYDSSLFPNEKYARLVKVKTVDQYPHFPLEHCRLMELPMPGYSPLPVPFHASYSLVLGFWYFRLSLHQFRSTGAPLVLLFHLTDFSDPLPDGDLPGWKGHLFTLSYLSRAFKIQRCKQMLELVKQNYTVVDTSSLVRAYTKETC